MNNRDSLRTQIIDAMGAYTQTRYGHSGTEFNIDIFDKAIFPVLDAAMKAGELLLHRATTPQKPVSDSLVLWLEGCCEVIGRVQAQEATVGRKEALRILYQMEQNAQTALAEVRGMRNHQQGTGSPLAGITHSPRKVKP